MVEVRAQREKVEEEEAGPKDGRRSNLKLNISVIPF